MTVYNFIMIFQVLSNKLNSSMQTRMGILKFCHVENSLVRTGILAYGQLHPRSSYIYRAK